MVHEDRIRHYGGLSTDLGCLQQRCNGLNLTFFRLSYRNLESEIDMQRGSQSPKAENLCCTSLLRRPGGIPFVAGYLI